MLDLLLETEKNDGIDDEGIKEEVATFVFEVSINLYFITLFYALICS
jgi:hypothetical protein